jgi:hypothetical protein
MPRLPRTTKGQRPVPARRRRRQPAAAARRRGRRGTRCCDAEGDGDDVGWRIDEEQKPAGGWEVLPADEDTTPTSFGQGDGEAGEEDDAAELREAMARPTDTQARQLRRLESAGGMGERGGWRGEEVRPRGSSGGG